MITRLVRSGVLALLATVAAGFLMPTRTLHAATFLVNSQTDAVDISPGNGICETALLPGEGVRCTLRAAIQEANAVAGADTVQIPAGLYLLTIPGADEDAVLTGDLDVLGDLTLVGAGAATTMIDANQLDRVLDIVTGVAAELRGLTIRNGRAAEGGGIRAKGHQLSLLDSAVAHNTATGAGPTSVVDWGGGILAYGNLVLTRSAVTANTATGAQFITGQGGGIRAGTVTLIDSTVTDNVVGSASPGGIGGGIASGGQVTLTNSTVSGNRSVGSASNEAGGIWSGTLMATNSLIGGNTASPGRGGGVHAASATLLNTTVTGNRVTGDGVNTGLGGGLLLGGGSSINRLTNATLYGNSAPQGSGVYSRQLTQFLNTLIAGNTGSAACSGSGVKESRGHNLESGDSCNFHSTGDLTNTDPKVGGLAFNGGPTMTHALQPGSPAIDGGDGANCPTTDQRDSARPVDGDGSGAAGCDIGAFEAPAWPCGTSRAVRVAVAPDGANRLRATLTTVPGTGTPPNTLQRLRIIGLDNVEVDVGSQTFTTPGVDVPIPPNAQQLVMIVRRPSGTGAGTARFVATDACSDWPTFVGGGPNAWSGGSVPASTEGSVSPAPARPASPASICQPRPAVSVNTRQESPGRVRVVVTATTSPAAPANGLRRIKFGALRNAAVEVSGARYVNGDVEVAFSDGTRSATFVVDRLEPGKPTAVPVVVVDDCGGWSTFVGSGSGVP